MDSGKTRSSLSPSLLGRAARRDKGREKGREKGRGLADDAIVRYGPILSFAAS
ncbi:hypothetical protein GCM10009115_10200 [Sphingopyxis soli]|uniref:Uncharacterized protein n=1 Tax=Sphingopyxis soli TaxID=592051 RepID=A0ABP3XED1_9SPHN